VFGVTYLASVSASFVASCTQHTIVDAIIAIIGAFVNWYDWNFHILQVVWQLICGLNSDGKNADQLSYYHSLSIALLQHLQTEGGTLPF